MPWGVASLWAAAALVSGGGVGVAAARQTFVVTADPGGAGGPPVPRNFLGFSTEVQSAPSMIGPAGTKASFAQLQANLINLNDTSRGTDGPVLRVGGNSADESCLAQPGSGPGAGDYTGCRYNISRADFEAYFNFASATAAATNMSFVLDTNFGRSPDPSVQVAEQVRQSVSSVPGLRKHISAFEIGNEIDIYAEHGSYRNASYDFDDYFVEFGQFAAAVAKELQQQPTLEEPAPFLQAATFCSDHWCMGAQSADLARYLETYGGSFRTLSWHKYATTTCNGKSVSLAQLLSARSSSQTLQDFAPVIQTCAAHGVPFVIGESNSASCGGESGVSDRFAAALWAAPYLASASALGTQAVYFHGGPHGPYAAIAYDSANDTTPEVRPLYYGLYAFAKLIERGGRWTNTTVSEQQQQQQQLHLHKTAAAAGGGDPYCSQGIQSFPACCAKSCGVCGGTDCDKLPGGAAACCAGAVEKANASCDDHQPPCVIDDIHVPVVEARSLVVAADATGGAELRTLVVAKSLTQAALGVAAGSVNVRVCPAAATAAATATARVFRLAAGSNASAAVGGGAVRFCGQTFDGSADGRPVGACVPDSVPLDSAGCAQFVLPPLEAAVVVQPLASASWATAAARATAS